MHQVQAGETLQKIAEAEYGDASLWYLIANANGLTGDGDLRVGTTVNVPTTTSGLHNTFETFKPYDPAQIIGSTTPQLSPPGPACGGWGPIIMIVVMIVITVVTAGAAAPAAAAMSTAMTAAGYSATAIAVAQAAGAAIFAAATSLFWSSPHLCVNSTHGEAPRVLHAALASATAFDFSRDMSR